MSKSTKMRVPLSRKPEEIILLGEKIYNKHVSLGAESPLKSMEDFNWDAVGPNISMAAKFHADAEALKAAMEKSYRERDLLINGIDNAVKGSRDILAGVYRKNMKRMGDWGFIVDNNPKVKPEPKSE